MTVKDDFSDDAELVGALRRAATDRDTGTRIADELERDADPPLANYRILRRIGEGGMGIVYEAEQAAPRRTVALKVLRPSATSTTALRRFEYEAEVLGRLDHPGIARILQAGSYDTGRGPQPWIAMEYVRGEPLSAHLEATRADRARRLELFLAICDAVHHAHQKGIIHRDLKPGNILVDESGRPKVLDFGIARAAGVEDDGAIPLTMTSELLGTLPYMSPEQLAGESDGLDVRSDVYALGVILYEMLADRLPFELSGLSLSEAVRVLERGEAPPLGTLSTTLRGDLETIAATAMYADRERRYGSATALAEDVERHLRREPIAARPPSRLYLLDRFARRNRTVVLGIAAVFAALVIGLVATWSQTVRARDAENRMAEALHRATNDARRSQAASAFLASVIRQASPLWTFGEEPTLRSVLEEAARRVGVELGDEPVVEAEVRLALGKAYQGLSDYERASEHLSRAMELYELELEPGDHRIACALIDLGSLAVSRGDYAEAEGLLARADDLERALEEPDAWSLALIAYNRGQAFYYSSQFEQAEPLLEEACRGFAVEGGPECGAVADAKVIQALVSTARRDLRGAETLLREALEIERVEKGPHHPGTMNTLSLLGTNLQWQGEYGEAQEMLEEALASHRESLGDDHVAIAIGLGALARLAEARGDVETAERLFREALGRYRRTYPDGHPHVAECALLLAGVLAGRGDDNEAEDLLIEGLAVYEGRPDRECVIVTDLLREYGELLTRANRLEESEAIFMECLDMAPRVYANRPEKLNDSRDAYGTLLLALGRYEEAEEQLLAVWEWVVANQRERSRAVPRLRRTIVELYEAWEKPDLAREFDDR